MEDNDTLRLEALKLLREWTVWMVAVQTGLIGFLVSLLLQGKIRLGSAYIKGAVICFGLSIACAAWVLGSIPSIAQRLNHDKRGIYALGIHDLPICRHLSLGWFSFFEHFGFVLGLLALIVSVTLGEIGKGQGGP